MDEPSTSNATPSFKMPKMIIPDEIIRQLKCSECSNYLSVGPVMMSSESKTICGRCVQNHPNKQTLKKSMYDSLAQGLIFKCIYHYQGCRTLVSFVNILDEDDDISHETRCTFKDRNKSLGCFKCSFIAENGVQLVAHLERYHRGTIIINKFKYKLSDKFNAVLLDNDYIFDINISFDDTAFKISISPYITAGPDNELNSFSLKIITPHSYIQYVLISSGKFSELLQIDVSDLKAILDKSRVITCEVAFNRKNTFEKDLYETKMELCATQKQALQYSELKQVLRKLLFVGFSTLHCVSCKNQCMDLYICGKGHTLCEQCNTCKICEYGKIPYFSLTENIYQYFPKMSCEWEGCKNISEYINFIPHNMSCELRKFTCPVKNCEFASMLDTFKQHFFGHLATDDGEISIIFDDTIRIKQNKHFYWVLNRTCLDIVVVYIDIDITIWLPSIFVTIDGEKCSSISHKYKFFIKWGPWAKHRVYDELVWPQPITEQMVVFQLKAHIPSNSVRLCFELS